MHVRNPLIKLVAVGALVAACSGASPTSSPSVAAPAARSVAITVQEFAILPDATSVPAGTVTFVVKNVGPDDVHEMVVVKTDLGPRDLPVDDKFKVTEDAEGMTVIGEVEDVEVGATKEVALDLTEGSYVLICNILQTEPDGTLESHYQQGMSTAFSVTKP